MTDQLARFMKFVAVDAGGCWLWQGCKSKAGYGKFGWKGKSEQAHRASWEIHKGDIPIGRWVLHRCDNPPCVNPEHLFLGDHVDNMRDCAAKGRNGMTLHPERSIFGQPGRVKRPGGERNGRAKLTIGQVSDIRLVLSRGDKKKPLARAYGVNDRTIRRIGIGEIWPIDAALSESQPKGGE